MSRSFKLSSHSETNVAGARIMPGSIVDGKLQTRVNGRDMQLNIDDTFEVNGAHFEVKAIRPCLEVNVTLPVLVPATA